MSRNLVCTNSHLVYFSFWLHVIVERLQANWHSAIYGFFQENVSVGYDEGCKYHFFKCASRNCKGKGQKGVRHYQDSKDRAATSKLKSHAVKCFGQDAVDAAFEKTQSRCDGSIFTAFACQGQQPVKISHRAHTTEETRWVLDFILNATTYEMSGLTLRDGVPKTTACIESSKTVSLKFLWKLGCLEHLFPAQWLSHVISRLRLNVAASALILS